MQKKIMMNIWNCHKFAEFIYFVPFKQMISSSWYCLMHVTIRELKLRLDSIQEITSCMEKEMDESRDKKGGETNKNKYCCCMIENEDPSLNR